MIKIIHCADVHLGSKMDSRLPAEKAVERRAEVREAFRDMVRYASDNGVKIILLSGDVFDSDRPVRKDKEFFYSVVKGYPEIDFLYLRGNHDGEQRYEEKPDNLKTFSSEWTLYEYGNVTISGIELAADNARSVYSTLNLPPENLNIVMLHGQIADTEGRDKINLLKLRGKNIDYLALGHLHAFRAGRIDERGEYAYSGCLEGRGFDETGEKGFVLLTVEDRITAEFIPRSKRKIVEVSADVSDAEDAFSACNLACDAVKCAKDDLVRLTLTGEIPFDSENLALDVAKRLSGDYYFVSVKDKTARRFDVDALSLDKSLKGEFIRTVLNDNTIPQELKSRVISAGLKALAGREVE